MSKVTDIDRAAREERAAQRKENQEEFTAAQRKKVQEYQQKRMDDIFQKLNLQTNQVIASMKKQSFWRRVEIAIDVIFRLGVDDELEAHEIAILQERAASRVILFMIVGTLLVLTATGTLFLMRM